MDASIAVQVDGPYASAYLATPWASPLATRLTVSAVAVGRPPAAIAVVALSRLSFSVEKVRLLAVVSLLVSRPTSAGIVADVLATKTGLL